MLKNQEAQAEQLKLLQEAVVENDNDYEAYMKRRSPFHAV